MNKILFVFSHPDEEYWNDGLRSALKLLEKDFEITYLNLFKNDLTNVPKDAFILVFDSFKGVVDRMIRYYPNKKGLCLAGSMFMPYKPEEYSVIFYETEYQKTILRHPNLVHAFGIDTRVYKKMDLPKVFDYIGVGGFALWKRWEKMIDKKGLKLVTGPYQLQNEQESLSIVKNLMRNRIVVAPIISVETAVKLFNMSKICYIPAEINGGGERAILEARSCGLPVEIEPDNPKLKELLTSPIWDAQYFADQLEKGVLSCLN